MGAFQQILYLRHAVHVAHFRMAVQLHTFLRRRIFAGLCKITDFADACHRRNNQLTVKFINIGHAFDFQERAHFYFAQYVGELVISDKQLDCDGIRKVSHREYDNRLLIANLTCLKTDHFPPERNLSHLAYYLAKLHRLVVKVASIDQVRVV